MLWKVSNLLYKAKMLWKVSKLLYEAKMFWKVSNLLYKANMFWKVSNLLYKAETLWKVSKLCQICFLQIIKSDMTHRTSYSGVSASNIRLVLFLLVLVSFGAYREGESGTIWLLKTYNFIAFANFKRTELHSLQNPSLWIILKIFLISVSIFFWHMLLSKDSSHALDSWLRTFRETFSVKGKMVISWANLISAALPQWN